MVPVRIGGVEVLVETVPVAGSEPTSKVGDAGDRVRAALNEALESAANPEGPQE
jgi:hypothetical protein